MDGDSPVFPNPEDALDEPDGLLAAGGELNARILRAAYRSGIFPWYEDPQPVLWWSPSQRAVLFPGSARISRSLRRTMRRHHFVISTNQAFDDVMRACAAPRAKAQGTWITPRMRAAYGALHRQGVAHSLELWLNDVLVGGLYGVQVGGVFCGESMFSHESDASKIAFACLSETLARHGFALIDCQLENPHLTSLGALLISRREFLGILARCGDEGIHWPESSDFQQSLCDIRDQNC